jgi:hypothetical protein
MGSPDGSSSACRNLPSYQKLYIKLADVGGVVELCLLVIQPGISSSTWRDTDLVLTSVGKCRLRLSPCLRAMVDVTV